MKHNEAFNPPVVTDMETLIDMLASIKKQDRPVVTAMTGAFIAGLQASQFYAAAHVSPASAVTPPPV